MNNEERLKAIYLQYINLKALILAMGVEWDELHAQMDRLAATIEAAQCNMELTINERQIRKD